MAIFTYYNLFCNMNKLTNTFHISMNKNQTWKMIACSLYTLYVKTKNVIIQKDT